MSPLAPKPSFRLRFQRGKTKELSFVPTFQMPIERCENRRAQRGVGFHEFVERAADDVPTTLPRAGAAQLDVLQQLFLADEVKRVAKGSAVGARRHALFDARECLGAVARIAGPATGATRAFVRASLARSVSIRHVIKPRSRRSEFSVNDIAKRARIARASRGRRDRIKVGVAEQTTRSPHPNALESSLSATRSA